MLLILLGSFVVGENANHNEVTRSHDMVDIRKVRCFSMWDVHQNLIEI